MKRRQKKSDIFVDQSPVNLFIKCTNFQDLGQKKVKKGFPKGGLIFKNFNYLIRFELILTNNVRSDFRQIIMDKINQQRDAPRENIV